MLDAADTRKGTETEADRSTAHAVGVWNFHADMIDAKYGQGFLGLRIAQPSVNRLYFRLDVAPDDPRHTNVVPLGVVSKRETDGEHWDAADCDVVYRAVVLLDDLSRKPLIFPDAQPDVFAWMRALLFAASVPAQTICAWSLTETSPIHV